MEMLVKWWQSALLGAVLIELGTMNTSHYDMGIMDVVRACIDYPAGAFFLAKSAYDAWKH